MRYFMSSGPHTWVVDEDNGGRSDIRQRIGGFPASYILPQHCQVRDDYSIYSASGINK